MHGIGQICDHLSVCLSVSLCVCVYVGLSVRPQQRPWFFVRSSSNVGQTCDNEDQVRWLIKPEVVNAHARQFTSGLADFSAPISRPILIKFGTWTHYAKKRTSSLAYATGSDMRACA